MYVILMYRSDHTRVYYTTIIDGEDPTYSSIPAPAVAAISETLATTDLALSTVSTYKVYQKYIIGTNEEVTNTVNTLESVLKIAWIAANPGN